MNRGGIYNLIKKTELASSNTLKEKLYLVAMEHGRTPEGS